MPRTPITTVITWRTKPTTVITCPRCIDYVTWDTTEITFDTTEITFDLAYTWWIETDWGTPRYAKYILDLSWTIVTDLSWNLVEWVSWKLENKIQTIIT